MIVKNKLGIIAVGLNDSQIVKQAMLVLTRGARGRQTRHILVQDGTTTKDHSQNQA